MKLCLTCHIEFNDDMDVCPKDNIALVTLSDDPLIGSTLQDRYKIEAVIGRGAMGVVYRASQEVIGREVAVKVLHTHLIEDNDALKRFHQQAKAASRLNHPHIITLYDYGVIAGGQPYIVMDLLKGEALSHLLEQREYLSLEQAQPIIRQVCEALADAHKHGVIHRDVKPDNIVLEDHNDQKQWVKVVDFGIAKILQSENETLVRITRTGMVCGSPAYMSPEQFKGSDVDQRTDIYSMAIVIFEMLTGRLPFQARDLVTLMSLHVSEMPPRLSKIRPDLDFSPELEKALEHALYKNLEDRPETMEDFLQELERGFSPKSADGVTMGSDEPALSGREIQDLVSAKISAKNKQVEEEVQKWARATMAQPSDGVSQSVTQRAPKARAAIPLWVRLVGMIQNFAPYIFTAALVGALFWFMQGDTELAGKLRDKLATTMPLLSGISGGAGDPARLFSSGRLNDARDALEKKKSAGSLSRNDSDLLNKIYLRLSENEAKKQNYKEAINLLEHVSGKGAQASKAKSLMRRYKRMIR